MDRRTFTSWQAVAVVGSLVAVTLTFTVGGPAVSRFSGLLGAVPIAIAAWYFGARIAVAVAIVEAIVNVGLVQMRTSSAQDLLVNTIEGAALALIAISAGVAQGAKRRLARVLATDSVTGLANRNAFMNELDRLFALDQNVTIGVLDLVDVAEVSDAFGYEVGDDLLRSVAGRLLEEYGPSVFVAKGGTRDAFLLIWPPSELSDEQLALRLLAIVEQPFLISAAELRPRARASVARRNTSAATEGSDLIRTAITALASAARDGQPWRSAEPAKRSEGTSRLELLSDLSRAIANNELRLHYQPIIDLTSGTLKSFEALVRWQHPARGLVPPLEFIPLAEQSGLIVPLTEWVLDEALRQSRIWADHARPVQLAVNVGAKTLTGPVALAAVIERLLLKHGVEPSRLCIEVTETDLMTDPMQAVEVLGRLKALGVRIEMDDFGTGYSSLAYLQRLPVDSVKIDRSFIAPLLDDDNTSAIVRAAIDLAHALGLDTVAEGVETDVALQRLKSMGCDAAQGYLIARPMPGVHVLSWIEEFEHGPAIVRPAPAGALLRTAAIEKATGVSSESDSRGTVLVVDDEHPFRLAAHRILTAQGYRVLHAATASEALRVCHEMNGDISLVLTDIHLSDWRGNDLAAHLRRSYPTLKIMFMSGDPEWNDHRSTDAFIAKPFSNRQLVERVAGALAS
jgi:predicted signal transduction protein with EAL and GGDEF domain/CheY-like chemotaxis protein